MNRVAIVMNKIGDFDRIVSDEPIRCFSVSDHVPNDRVYEFRTLLDAGPVKVSEVLGNDTIGHANDDFKLNPITVKKLLARA